METQEKTASRQVFKARNGMQIRQAENGGVEVGKPGFLDYTTPAVTFALEEFFQAKRDEELGRWRHPENPDYVVYPNPDEAFERMFGPDLDLVVLRESDGMTKGYVRAEDMGGEPMAHRTGHILAARAYFDAHPVRKPWEAAEPGEAWALTIDGVEAVAVVDASYDFTTASQTLAFGSDDMDVVEDARRIFPAVKP